MSKWTQIGVRKESIFDKSIKLEAWSNGLKEEIGLGYAEFIATSDGGQFVLLEEDKRILYRIKQSSPSFKYVEEMEKNNHNILSKLKGKDVDFIEILDLIVKQLASFFIAKEEMDLMYSKRHISDLDKKRIEDWRNNSDIFLGQERAIKVISEKVKLSREVFERSTLEEVRKIVTGGEVDIDKIRNRKDKEWSLVLKDNEVEIFLENKSPIRNKVVTPKIITGKSVLKFDKKIRGIVGEDILVVAMTDPDMISIVKRMKAVITDEGGVLCHAAITAREFKIPTIIGTKIATKVLKSGDEVEVDADKGVVKVLG